MVKETTITQNSKIVIYGCGEVGTDCFRILKKNNFYISYALDKLRYGNDIIPNIHTYMLGTEIDDDKENKIVIICLADGMQHRKVAEGLYQKGYRYIVFLPLEYDIKDSKKRELTQVYNMFLCADKNIIGKKILDYKQYSILNQSIEKGIISEISEKLIVWCGIEILFTECIDLWTGDKSKVNTNPQYINKSIAANIPGKSLFDFFDLDTLDSERYFEFSKKDKTDIEKIQELQKREKLFRVYKSEHNKGMGFFIEGAPSAIWNPKNYWNLVGGHHRTLYLLHEGHTVFPIKISKTDFQKWSNQNVYEELNRYIFTNNIQTLYAPLPHPGFINFPSRYEKGRKTKLEKVLTFLADKDISQMISLDCLEDEGYFARIMERNGIKESVFTSANNRQLELAKICNRLLYRNGVVIEKEDKKNRLRQYDIVFGKEENKNNLFQVCSKYLFIEKNIPIQTVQYSDKDSNYTCLLKEYYNGKIHEFGVYSR